MHVSKIFLAGLFIAVLCAAAISRNATWNTLLEMWLDCAAKSPGKSRSHNNLGNCYALLNRHFPAIGEYQRAVALEPGNMEAQFNLASMLDEVGLYRQAIPHYEAFCRFSPPDYAEQRQKACARVRELLGRTPSNGDVRP